MGMYLRFVLLSPESYYSDPVFSKQQRPYHGLEVLQNNETRLA